MAAKLVGEVLPALQVHMGFFHARFHESSERAALGESIWVLALFQHMLGPWLGLQVGLNLGYLCARWFNQDQFGG